jgi:transcriptional regulator with XRE-family HTH domain
MTEKEFYKWLGNRIKELRERTGLKQKEVAEKVNLPAQFLSNVENSGKRLSTYQLNRILEVMGYSQADLIEDEKKKNLRLSFAR